MATIIDRFLITIGLDPKEYKKGQQGIEEGQEKIRKSATKTQKQFDEDAKKAVASFRSIRNEVLSLAAAFIGFEAVKGFTEDIIGTDAAIGRFAHSLGVGTEQISAWEQAAKDFGATAGEMDAAFRALQKINQELALTGEFSGEDRLLQLGFDLNAFQAKSGNVVAQMEMMRRFFSSLSVGNQQSAGGAIGFSPNVSTMLGYGKAVDDSVALQYKLGVATEKSAKAAQALEQRWNHMMTPLRAMGRDLVFTIAPVVLTLAERFERWALTGNHIHDLGEAIAGIAKDIGDFDWKGFGADLKLIFDVMGQGVKAVGGLKNAIELLGVAFIGFKAVQVAGALSNIVLALTSPALLAAAGALAVPFGVIAAGAAALAALPGVNAETGSRDIATGHLFDASTHLSASDFASVFKQFAQTPDSKDYHATARGERIIHIDSLNVDVVAPAGYDPLHTGQVIGKSVMQTVQAVKGPN